MSDRPQHTITIWFFVGVLFAIYGVLITGCGIWGLFSPPDVVLAKYNVSLWWGMFLTAFGFFFTYRFWPKKEQLTGEADGESKSD